MAAVAGAVENAAPQIILPGRRREGGTNGGFAGIQGAENSETYPHTTGTPATAGAGQAGLYALLLGRAVLLEVMSRACERCSLMVTINLSVEAWIEAMGNERLTHRLPILEAKGRATTAKMPANIHPPWWHLVP